MQLPLAYPAAPGDDRWTVAVQKGQFLTHTGVLAYAPQAQWMVQMMARGLPRLTWRALVAAIAFVFLAPTAAVAQGSKHRAVLIGNNYAEKQYASTLTNAIADARSMEDLLVNKLGVPRGDVFVQVDADRSSIHDTWDRALDDLTEGVAIFFFSGHGIEVRGTNYLVPNGAPVPKSDKDRDLIDAFVSFDEILGAFRKQQDKHPKLIGIFILDACRENPFPDRTKSFSVVAKGFAPVRLPQNSETFVMYAAGAGQLALDALRAEQAKNSLYTRHLLEELPDRARADSVSLADLAQNIREKVAKAAREADHAQVPSYYDQLVQRRTLLGAPLKPLSIEQEKERLRPVPVAATAVRTSPSLLATTEPTPMPPDCDGCPSLVAVPAGRFGNVQIRALAFGKTEVTNREWNICVTSKECQGYRGFSFLPEPYGRYRENKPVTDVSWSDAKTYVDWLSKVTKQAYRLPTEAEWEYAALAGSKGPYAFGDKLEDVCNYANGADQSLKTMALATASCKDRYARETAPVATYRANAFGLHDMHGNVWEWVDGCWTDTPGPVAKSGEKHCDRIARGGSWRSSPKHLEASSRTSFPESHGRSTLGFRVVRELSP